MAGKFAIRRAAGGEGEEIVRLVLSVVQEVYGHLIAEIPPPLADWDRSWVAVGSSGLVGVGLAGADWIEDLWVSADHRGMGIGTGLLSALEMEIAAGGHDTAKLRVVAENHRAQAFYAAHGWRETARYPHEKWGFTMADMVKHLEV
jgi:GNAT superfamily N-acetyltransferase